MKFSDVPQINTDAMKIPRPYWSARKHFVVFLASAVVLTVLAAALRPILEKSFGLTPIPQSESIGQFGFYLAPLTQFLLGMVSFWVGTSFAKRYLAEPSPIATAFVGAVYSGVFYFFVTYILNVDSSSPSIRLSLIIVGLLFPGLMMIVACLLSRTSQRLG